MDDIRVNYTSRSTGFCQIFTFNESNIQKPFDSICMCSMIVVSCNINIKVRSLVKLL